MGVPFAPLDRGQDGVVVDGVGFVPRAKREDPGVQLDAEIQLVRGAGGSGERRGKRERRGWLVLRAKKGGAVSAMCFPARTHQREGERHGHQDREKVDGQRSPVDRLRDRVERRHILESPPTRAQQPASKHWAPGAIRQREK